MKNIRIQDDLYNYVNGETLEKLVIPDDKPYAGGFAELADGVEKTMMAEFAEMSESKSYPNEYLKKACEQARLYVSSGIAASLGESR